ncbi:MAG: AAA family ATPase, partial [Anaerolineae bacterium]|nr:AAA family ATPase [Anaerolineae bacterium]
MNRIELTPEQRSVVAAGPQAKLFLTGPAGTGKTTAGVARMNYLLETGVPADRILVIAPQRTLALPYDTARRAPQRPAGGQVNIATVGGLARRMIDLFWP